MSNTAAEMESSEAPALAPASKLDATSPPTQELVDELRSESETLQHLRDQWRDALEVRPKDGDEWNVIPQEFLDKACSLEASSVAHLASLLGKLNCSTVVNENGALYAEESEPVSSKSIPPELFQSLVNTFGLEGTPVIRNIIQESEESFVMERFPPYFIVHTLSDSSARVTAYQGLRNGHCFSLSQTKTFRDLVLTVQKCIPTARKTELRVWFVSSENIAELPAVVPVTMFVNSITETKVVEPRVMDLSLRSQGIRSSTIHLVIELKNKLTEDYPLDQFISRQESRAGQDTNLGGNLGLSNLGNTCYMNSALQCLAHIPEVNQYFFYDLYLQELNKENPLGNNGDVATSFSTLLHKLFDPKGGSCVTPREFKYTIGRYSSMFHGYQQQDTQEFLSWLLDALHEDLNRIHKKPYTEKPELRDEDVGKMDAIVKLAADCWDLYKQRNDSIIVDLFTGLYQSTLVCPICEKQSITFDPFNDFTLPLPVSKKWYHTFTIVDISCSSPQIKQLEVELSKTSNFEDLKAYLSDFLKVEPAHLFLYEIFRNFFYKDFQTSSSVNKFIPISELISDDDNVIVYIIPHDPIQDLIVPLVNIVQDADDSYSIKEPFGVPLFVVCDKFTDVFSLGSIRTKVEQVVKILSNENLEEQYSEIKREGTSKYFSSNDFPLLKKDSSESDEKMEDLNSEGALEGYDSDISLAHPSVSASFGFEIKVYEDSQNESARFRSSQALRLVSDVEGVSQVIHIPQSRPYFKNLSSLADKLPELKRNYYHYPDYVLRIDGSSSGLCLSRDHLKYYEEAQENGFEVVGSSNLEKPQDLRSDQSMSSGGKLVNPLSDAEDSDCGGNWVDVEPLLSSVDKLTETGSDADRAPPASQASTKTENEKPDPATEKRPPLVDSKSMLVIEWNGDIYKQFFGSRELQSWMAPSKIPNPKLEESKKRWNLQQSSTISLHDCLKSFSVPEVLGDQDLWYCPKCKDHRRATKTIQLWSTGDILTIHLKRFQSARRFSDKISSVVDFPIEGLDMSDYVNSPTKDEDLIYDLIAVDNHFGGLGGGHYTASAKNFRDGKWYYFNDSRVTLIDDPKECITSAAYLLFYKKRTSSKFAGGLNVESLLTKGRAEYDQKLSQRQAHILHIVNQLSDYYVQLNGQNNTEEVNESDKGDIAPLDEDEEEDLYGDIPEALPSAGSNKKSRSPMSEQSMQFEFENQRKQRLISKTSDLPRSVNINLGYSSSASNLASPEGSSSSEEDAIFD